MPKPTTMRVHLSCSCRSPKPHWRYARSLDGLVSATRAWFDRGGHANPNHVPAIKVEAMRFAPAPREQAALLEALGR
jgi:hypothetical protein